MKPDPNQRISKLTLEKRALLEAHLLQLQHKKSPTGGIPRRGAGSTWPLSFGQERLWFLHNLEHQRSWYNAPHAFRLEGHLDVSALDGALEEIVRRHEVLRTCYESLDDRLVQVLGEVGRVAFRQVDLRHWSEGDKAVEVNRLIAEEASRGFDLSRDLMVRGTLVREQDTRWVLLLVVHHIATDEWSQGILFRELGQLYRAFRRGEASAVQELPIQYADYSVWQRQRLSGEILEQQVSYWKQQLGAELPLLRLPADRERPVMLSHHGERVKFVLPSDLSRQIRDLARREGATLFMTLLAAFNVLLYRYTGHTDLVVGTPIAGRTRPELEGLIGFFVNTLVLRTNLSGDLSFRELLSKVRQVVLGAYGHQELPFERLVEELQPKRNMSLNPLFQVMFVLANAPGLGLELDGIKSSRVEADTGTAKFDLTLVLSEDKEELQGVLEYSTDLFDSNRILRITGHYEELLRDIVANPAKPISRLSLLTLSERSQLLKDCSARTPFSADLCAHELFEQHAERAPENVAVAFGDQLLTYEELNTRANQLAYHLRAQGLRPEDRVGVCIGRSVELIVALLGVLKAGGAYVPLDPGYPDDRLSFMLQDAGVQMLLGMRRYQDKLRGIMEQLPTRSLIRCEWLDYEWPDIAKQNKKNLPPAVTTDHLAYVIYTSGTTGRPKGVQVTHRNMVRLFSATEHLFQFNESDVWTLFHSYAFDFSVWELWGALLYGGRLVVVPYLVSRDPRAFYELLVREEVTVLNQTPSAFRQLIQAENAVGEVPLALRYVIFGGEALEMQSLRPWFDRHGDREPRLVNMYGITETAVHVTCRPLSKSDLDSGSVIGRPIPDLQVYVLDRWQQPMPIGVPGELFVGGAGLARGYLNGPELTAERFVPHPFGDEPGSRLYRTGDLARLLAGGELEYVGRIDHQVKIRGFRIEPGEIESVLVQHPTVREAVVRTIEDSRGDKRLVAYLVASSGPQKAIAGELRNFLNTRLPDYMIPADYVWLDQFPLNSIGKLDFKALPQPDRARPEIGTVFEAPRSEIEKVLASIWTELLDIESPGMHDNFFDLGGHSLLATQVTARVQARLGVAVSLRAFFDGPTLEDLARVVERSRFAGT